MPSALAIVALSSSMSAQTSARHAEEISCHSYVMAFKNESATISDAQQYASCVNLLYPKYEDKPIPVELILCSKLAIIIVLIALMAGALSNPNDRFDGAFLGFIVTILAAIIIGLSYFAITFLFS